MADLKRITPKNTTIEPEPVIRFSQSGLTIRDGWNFGIGFFIAAFIFTFVVVPAISCSALIVLTMLGLSLPAG